jgi:uncharacterized cofD-like protein
MELKVAVMGGGTGNFTVLAGLKLYKSLELSAVVSMVDDGGSTGILRNEFGILPPGDVRQCMIAMSEESALIQKLFQYRFKGSIGNHNFGNLFHLALSEITGSEENAVAEMSRILKIAGEVVPVTWENIRLKAELEDGTIVDGETNIDLPKHDPNLRISRIFLSRPANANPRAISSLQEADSIIISPGDLFTSTLPNFLVDGIKETFSSSRALKIYVCNLMTKHGETLGFSAADHVRAVHQYIGKRCIDAVIVNSSDILDERILEYAKEHSHPVKYDIQSLLDEGVTMVVESDVVSPYSLVRHDSGKIAWELFKLMQENKHRYRRPSKITVV